MKTKIRHYFSIGSPCPVLGRSKCLLVGHFHQRWLQNLGPGLYSVLIQIYFEVLCFASRSYSETLNMHRMGVLYWGTLNGGVERGEVEGRQKPTDTMR